MVIRGEAENDPQTSQLDKLTINHRVIVHRSDLESCFRRTQGDKSTGMKLRMSWERKSVNIF